MTNTFQFAASRMHRVTAAGDINVAGAKHIIFDTEVQFYLDGASSSYMDVIAWYAIGIDGATTIHVDGPCGYALM